MYPLEYVHFIIKRAFWFGKVTRSDAIRALDISPNTAAKLIATARAMFPGLLERNGQGYIPKPMAKPPRFVTEEALLAELDTGKNNPLRTGFFDWEIPLVYVSWTNSMPYKEGILNLIIKAIRKELLIRIIYIGLRRDKEPRERRILPLALERMNDQWRVIAQDVEIEDAPIRVFVLSRILDARLDKGKKPNIIRAHKDSITELDVIMNSKYSELQKEIIGRELRVEKGKVKVATRSLHEFARRFADKPPSPDAVWPPLRIKGE